MPRRWIDFHDTVVERFVALADFGDDNTIAAIDQALGQRGRDRSTVAQDEPRTWSAGCGLGRRRRRTRRPRDLIQQLGLFFRLHGTAKRLAGRPFQAKTLDLGDHLAGIVEQAQVADQRFREAVVRRLHAHVRPQRLTERLLDAHAIDVDGEIDGVAALNRVFGQSRADHLETGIEQGRVDVESAGIRRRFRQADERQRFVLTAPQLLDSLKARTVLDSLRVQRLVVLLARHAGLAAALDGVERLARVFRGIGDIRLGSANEPGGMQPPVFGFALLRGRFAEQLERSGLGAVGREDGLQDVFAVGAQQQRLGNRQLFERVETSTEDVVRSRERQSRAMRSLERRPSRTRDDR